MAYCKKETKKINKKEAKRRLFESFQKKDTFAQELPKKVKKKDWKKVKKTLERSSKRNLNKKE